MLGRMVNVARNRREAGLERRIAVPLRGRLQPASSGRIQRKTKAAEDCSATNA